MSKKTEGPIVNILFFLTPKSEVDYIEESASVLGTVRKMKECNYSEIPVISKNGKYVGISQIRVEGSR